MVVETCPKCGNPLIDGVIATFPPIPTKRCFNCGWYWEGKPEPIEYVPFRGNGEEVLKDVDTTD